MFHYVPQVAASLVCPQFDADHVVYSGYFCLKQQTAAPKNNAKRKENR